MAHIMTPRRKAALKKAQAASARKRRSMKTRIKRKGRKLVNKARKNAQPAARTALRVGAQVGTYRFMRHLLGPGTTNMLYASHYLNKAANGAYNKAKKRKKK